MMNSNIVNDPRFVQQRGTAIGKKIVEYGLSFERITQSQGVIIIANAFAIKNSGTSTFEIDRSVTLGPGERLEFGTDSYFELYYQKMNIDFITGGTNLCEITKVTANIPEIDNYSGKAV